MTRDVDDHPDFSTEHERELAILAELDRIATGCGVRYYLAYGTLLGAVRHHGFIPWDLDVDVMVSVADYPTLMAALAQELDPTRWQLHWQETDPTYDQLLARIGVPGVSLLETRFDIFPMAGAPAHRWLGRLLGVIAHLNHRAFFFKKVNIAVNYADRPRLRLPARLIKIALGLFPASFFVAIHRWLSNVVPWDKAPYAHNLCGSYGARELIPTRWLEPHARLQFENLELSGPGEWDAYLTQMYGDYLTPVVRKTA